MRKWCRQAEVDRGDRPGVSTEEAAEVKRLKSLLLALEVPPPMPRRPPTGPKMAPMPSPPAKLPVFDFDPPRTLSCTVP